MAKKVIPADILDSLTAADALQVLRAVAARHPEIAAEIRELSEDSVPVVNLEAVAVTVQDELELVEIEDVWEAAGQTRYGYVDPSDAAYEIFEEALREYRDEISRYLDLGRSADMYRYFLGILKGLYDFNFKSTTTFVKEYMTDEPDILFSHVLHDWKQLDVEGAMLPELDEFLAAECPEWSGQ